jgi:hypothetical protein
MTETRFEHQFSCSEATFWGKVFFDPEYNRRLFLEELKCPDYRLLELEETDEQIVRVHQISPRVAGVPGPISSLIGAGFSYVERDVFTRQSRRMNLVVTPSRLSSKLDIRGVYYTVAEGLHRCRRVFECQVVCKLPGVGGLLEKQIVSDMHRDYELTATFTERYLAEQHLEGSE